ncbi:MAG: STAS domain-containing protein [Pseudomonadota bacterium]|nr:STAS domain-containing protein [Pseudomonadota bacterium]
MSTTHTLPAEMTIYSATGLRTTFKQWLRKTSRRKRAGALPGKPLVVDAALVVEIDAAGLQLLIALSRSLAAEQRPLQLDRPSQALRTACSTLGLGEFLLGAAGEVP